MKKYPVIGIVGLQGSGKTEVASKLVEEGATRVRMGDIVWKEIENRDLEVSDENVGLVANELREKEGMNAIAKRCIPVIRKKGKESKAIVVDGIRGIAEVEKYEDEFGEDFVLLSIESSEKTRYGRIKNRKREDDIKDFGTFKEKDTRELNWGMKEAMESADYKISNEGSLSQLKEKTSIIFKEIMSEYES